MTRSPPSKLRRPVFAIFLALVTFVLLGGVIGFAQAADEPPQGVPRILSVPALTPGDSAKFSVVSTFTRNGSVESNFEVALEAGAPIWIRNADGVPNLVMPIAQEFAGQENEKSTENRRVHFRTLDGELVATETTYYDQHDWPSAWDGGVVEEARTSNTTSEQTRRKFVHREDVLCLAENSLQNRTVALAVAVEIWPQGCRWPSQGGFSLGFGEFRAVAVDTVDGEPTVVFEEQTTRESLLWFSDSCPYPIQIVVPRAWIKGEESITVVAKSLACSRAQMLSATPMSSVMPQGRAPPLRAVALGRMGPAPDYAMEFSLSQAWDTAIQDENSNLSAFIREHPRYYVGEATYLEGNGGRNRGWSFYVTDGTEAMHVSVGHVERTESYVPRVALGVQLTEPSYDIHVGYLDPSRSFKFFPDLDSLPPNVVSPASLAARWEHHNGNALDEPIWGFEINCKYGNCSNPEVVVWAGGLEHVETSSRDLAQQETSSSRVTRTSVFEWSSLPHAGDDPETAVVTVAGYASETRYTLLGNGNTNARPSVQPAASVNWVQPDASWTIGAGLAAIVVGLLYWLWPQLKVVGFGLFSRIERPAALEQQARREIMSLVEASPGVHVEEVIRRTGYGNGTVNHHVRKLVETGLVTVTGDGYRCLFPKGKLDADVARAVPLLKGETARKLVEAVAVAPCTQKEVAIRIGITPPSCHYFVHRLCKAGIVVIEEKGGRRLIHATPRATQALALLG